MSGPPHMATAFHIMKMVRLQDGGENILRNQRDHGQALTNEYVRFAQGGESRDLAVLPVSSSCAG
ncbi:hypothetical protein GCM10011579_039810 [Streptomyces albiflavescens]|uniref:Uncharacterized protein n=1 Tax=Streptomyces albiflavescens TaxID=1623582 RepID=A0A917Y6X8_9ACTN|nr:hypothetical protein GCM10011579_039810 [Streptomyces albiflavescens]